MQQYKELIDRILTKSQESKDRTGVGTVFLFGETIKFDLAKAFPIVSLRKVAFKQAVGELAGFLKGATSKEEFTALGCTYWNTTGVGDNLGPIYGAQWRQWGTSNGTIDQLTDLVTSLIANPHSRRHILSTWNVGQLADMALPPCHMTAQFNIHDGKLSCIVYMRSVDVMLGLPYDAIVYALLTHLLANEVGLAVGTLEFMFGNAHIYKNHYMDAIRLIKLEPQAGAPILILPNEASVFNFLPQDAALLNYNPGPEVKFKLNL